MQISAKINTGISIMNGSGNKLIATEVRLTAQKAIKIIEIIVTRKNFIKPTISSLQELY